jgi:signal transduction histidine kinase
MAIQAQANEVTVRISGAAPVVVVDPDLLSRTLANLLENAIRHAPAGSVVAVRIVADERGVEVRIADAGPGVPAALRERIFEKFFRIDHTLTSSVPGTGLGLSISQKLLRLMGGDIAVDSQPGQGSTFWAELPLPCTEAQMPAAAAAPRGARLAADCRRQNQI